MLKEPLPRSLKIVGIPQGLTGCWQISFFNITWAPHRAVYNMAALSPREGVTPKREVFHNVVIKVLEIPSLLHMLMGTKTNLKKVGENYK